MGLISRAKVFGFLLTILFICLVRGHFAHANIEPFSIKNPLSPYVRPKVVFTFDDVYQSVYDFALPILRSKQMPATVFVATKNASDGNPLYMKWSSLHEIVTKNGWEVGGHSVNHVILETQTESVVEAEVRGSYQELRAQGFNPVSFAVPYGSYTDKVLSMIHKYYKYNRGFWTGSPMALDELRNLLNIAVIPVSNGTSIGELKNLVDQAVRESKTLILVFHRIESGTPALDRWGYGQSQFAELVDYVAQKAQDGAIDVVTMKKALDVGPNEGHEIVNLADIGVNNLNLATTTEKWMKSRNFKVQGGGAYLVRLSGEAEQITPESRFDLFIEEKLRSGEVKQIPFLTEAVPESFILSWTYFASPTALKARLVWKIKAMSSGRLSWHDLHVWRRIKQKRVGMQ